MPMAQVDLISCIALYEVNFKFHFLVNFANRSNTFTYLRWDFIHICNYFIFKYSNEISFKLDLLRFKVKIVSIDEYSSFEDELIYITASP